MNKNDKDFVYTEGVRAGKRIYYFDVKQSHNGEKFVCITESKKIVEGESDNPNVRFEKHKIFLYKEDYEKFLQALNRAVDIAKGDTDASNPTHEATDENVTSALGGDEIKIDLDF